MRYITCTTMEPTTMEPTLQKADEWKGALSAFSNAEAAGNGSNKAAEWPKDPTVVAPAVGVAAYSGIVCSHRLTLLTAPLR